MPIKTETIIPIRKGCSSVAHIIIFPNHKAALPIGGAIKLDTIIPTTIVTRGVTRISTLVSLDTSFPASAAIIEIKYTASGPPAPPSAFAAKPTDTIENNTSGGHFRA